MAKLDPNHPVVRAGRAHDRALRAEHHALAAYRRAVRLDAVTEECRVALDAATAERRRTWTEYLRVSTYAA